MMRELIVDNFAGGGGASTGIEMAIGRSVDIAINHDPDAIAMHKVNHPRTKHYCENVWEVDPIEVCNGHPVGLAWFSPDCKHFSRAKGGKPVDKNIRGLAWVAIKWAYLVQPRVIMLENVPEFQTWGPLGDDNKPLKDRVGETFKGFIAALSRGLPKEHPAFTEMCEALEISETSKIAESISKNGLGYKVEYKMLKSCDFGAPTTRTRFYLIARRDGEAIVWPKPTHAPRNSNEVRRGEKFPYRTAAECIDWTIPAKSIFERDKPLAENTLRRIARGIQKFVIENPKPFIIPIGYGERKAQKPRVNSIEEPLNTVVSSGKHYLIVPTLIQYHSETVKNEVRGQEVNEPIMTVDTARRNMDGQPVDEPLTTVSCSGAHHAEVQAFLIKYFSTGAAKSVVEPLDTVTTKDRFALVTIHGEKYIITDIKMRMLQPHELFAAQGFPADYIIDRDAYGKAYPKSKQVARCGNAVTPPVPAALVRVNLPEYCEEPIVDGVCCDSDETKIWHEIIAEESNV